MRGCRATLPVYGVRKCGWRPRGIPLRLVTVAGRPFRGGRMDDSPHQTGCHVRPAGVPRDAWRSPSNDGSAKGRTATAGTLAKSTDGMKASKRVCRLLISTSPPLRLAVSRFRETARGRWTPEPSCHHRHEWVSTSPLWLQGGRSMLIFTFCSVCQEK